MDFLPQALQDLLQGQPWWVYALLMLIPFCVLLSVREFFCWFWKMNKVVSRLERIERSLKALEQVAPVEKPLLKAVNEPNERTSSATKTGDFKLE